MAIFQNAFFSTAGQKERLTNVASTLKAAVTGKGVASNTGVGVLDKALSVAASHPFSTASIAAAGVSPKTAIAAIQAAPKTVIGVQLAVPALTSFAVSSPKSAQNVAETIATAPEAGANFAGNIGKAIENPTKENLLNIAKENPLITGALVLGTAATIGASATGAVSTALNTAAVRENTAATKKEQIVSSVGGQLPATMGTSAVSATPTTMQSSPINNGLPVARQTTSLTTKRRKRSRVVPSVNKQSVRVNVINIIGRNIKERRHIASYGRQYAVF